MHWSSLETEEGSVLFVKICPSSAASGGLPANCRFVLVHDLLFSVTGHAVIA